VQQIYPLPSDTGVERSDLADLADAYAYPDLEPGRAWLRANMVSTIDGAAHGPDGVTASISSPADRTVLGLLRALSDVVLAGAGTVRAERYGPADVDDRYAELRRRNGQPPAPPIAVVSRRLDLDPASDLFSAADRRTLVFTVGSAPADRRAALAEVADVEVVGDTDADLHRVLSVLAERGLGRVLCEGGPHLLADIVRTGVLDELCYTMTPLVVGGHAARLLDGAPMPPRPWRLAHIIEDDGTLLTRWTAR
jgi:riboflavin biosynthesis pyrimidine reductase